MKRAAATRNRLIFFTAAAAFVLFGVWWLFSPQGSEEHLHALAFDRADPSAVYAGTHEGLERFAGSGHTRVGTDRADFMGFVIASDGTFYSSGHSRNVADVGVRKSTDKGETWTTLAFEGEDFHNIALSDADPNVIYVWSTPPTEFLAVSKDAGNSWSEVNVTNFSRSIFSLAADHQNPGRLYAATLSGLHISDDFGIVWQPIPSLAKTPVTVVADDPLLPGVMYVWAYRQGVMMSKDEGAQWVQINEGLPANDPIVFMRASPVNAGNVIGFTKTGIVYRFNGERWERTAIAA